MGLHSAPEQPAYPSARAPTVRLLTVILAVGASVVPASAQTTTDFTQEWRWSDFGPAQGTPTGHVRGMAEDGERVWLFTSEEVAYFDGFMWRRPPGLDSVTHFTSLHAVAGSGLAVAGDGRLYIGDHEGLDPVEIPGVAAGSQVRRVAWQAPGLLYFTVFASDEFDTPPSLYVRRGGVVSHVQVPGTLPSATPALWPTNGGVYLSTLDALYQLDPRGTWQQITGLGTGRFEPVLGLAANASGQGYAQRVLDMRQGIQWGPGEPLTSQPAEGEHVLRSAAVTPGGTRLAVYDNGSLRVRTEAGWTTAPLAASRAQGLRTVFASRTGDVWVTSSEGVHLLRHQGTRWRRIQRSEPPGRNRINDFDYVAETGEIWLATGAGLVKHHRGTSTEYFELGGSPLPGVTTVARDSAGSVWFGSGGSFRGAYRIDPNGSWDVVGEEEGLGYVHRVVVDRLGQVYILALGAPEERGAYRVQADGSLERLSDPRGVLSGRVYSFAEGPGATLWFGSNRGIARLRNGRWASWTGEELGPGFSQAWAMAVDPTGTLWVSPGKTLDSVISTFDEATGRLLPQDSPDRIAARAAWSITFDEDGDLWAGTESGISHLKTGVWFRIDGRQGLGATLVWPVRVTSEQVWIGTANGLMILDRAEGEAMPAPLVEIEPGEFSRGRARWRWTVAGFRGEPRPSEVEVRYALDDGPWSEWTRRTTLDTVLTPGLHTLKVQSKGTFGQISDPRSGEIRVPPPTLLRPMVFLPGGLLATALLFVGFQARSRRRQRDAAVRESEGRLRALLELAPEGILIYHGDRNELVEANEQVQELLGYPPGSLLGKTPMSLCPPEQPGGVRSSGAMAKLLARALEAGEVIDLEWTFEHREGNTVPTRLRLSRLPEPESHLVRLSLVDLTAQKREEATRRSLEIQLVQAQKLEAVGQLTGGVAHDFNNLLTVIRGNLEFLHRDDGQRESEQYIEQAIRAADRGTELVKRLLAFSMRQTLAPDRIDLRDTLSDLLPLMERSLGESIQVSLDVAPDARWVSVDRAQLDSAVMNLAVNARDAMPRGGDVHITVVRSEVSGEMAEAAEVEPGSYLRISVSDTGTGMPSELVDRVFEPFFTTKEVGRGSGLGLSMVYGFARQSGGFARISSHEGRGTQVHIYLPPHDDTGPSGHANEDAGADAATRPRQEALRLLVVEDDGALQDLLANLLEFYGHEVVVVGTAAEAEAQVARGFVPDVLVSDVVLPGSRTGPELGRDLQARHPGMGVALISGYQPENLPVVLDPEIPFLAKPFDGPSLEKLVRAAASQASSGSAV